MPLTSLLLGCVLLVPVDQPLSIAIETEKAGIVDYDMPFCVVLTNNSDKPVKVWAHDSKPGHDRLSFHFANVHTGEKWVGRHIVTEDEHWEYIRDRHGTIEESVQLAPHETYRVRVDFRSYAPVRRGWIGLPCPNGEDKYLLSAQWESAASNLASKHSVWTGSLNSTPAEVKFIGSAMKKPHDYLVHGYSTKAIEMMKTDPQWIKTGDAYRATALHYAARHAQLDAVLWLLNNGANVNARGTNDSTPLHSADDPEVVALLLQKKPDLTAGGVSGTPMQSALRHYSAASTDAEKKKWKKIIDLYLKAGAEYDVATAIHLGDLDQLRKLLTKSPQLSDDFQGGSPLRLAASLGRVEICKYLIDTFHMDVNDFKRGGGYPIIKEALAFPNVVKLLIDNKADLKTRITWQGFSSGPHIIGNEATALHHAADDGTPETCKLLMDAGVDLLSKADDSHGEKDPEQTALEVAAYFGKTENAKVMLQHPQFKALDAKVRQTLLNKCLIIGAYPSWLAREAKRPDLIKVLLVNGADPLAKVDNRTAIQVIFESIHPENHKELSEAKEIIALLRSNGASLNLFGAVAINDEAEVNRLLQLDPKCANDRRSDGYPALHFAISMNQKKIVSALLNAGADIHIRNKADNMGTEEETPLHATAWWRKPEMVKLLLAAGADVNARNARQATPLHEAADFNSVAIARMLLEKGADPDARDRNNKTPLDIVRNLREQSPREMEKLFDHYRKK